MFPTQTFPMHHPEHGECVADESCEANLVELGWTRESADGSEEGDKGEGKGAKAPKGAKA